MTEIIQIGDYGPLFKLRAPYTGDSLRSGEGVPEKLPWRCRHHWHRRETIGDVHIPEGDLTGAACALIASSDVRDLRRCKRCGQIGIRGN